MIPIAISITSVIAVSVSITVAVPIPSATIVAPLPVARARPLLRLLFDAVLGMLNVHLRKEVLFEGAGERLNMHIVAIAASFAAAVEILLALGIAKVGDGGIVGDDLAAVVETAVDVFHGVLSVLLSGKLDVGVADDVLAQVVHHDHFLDLAEVAHLRKDVFVELFEPKHLRARGYLVIAFSASSLLT